MNLKHVKLRGLIGLADGIGKAQIELDLTSLRGVVALIGPNGKGKTTFLECLQPFRFLPSRQILFKDAVNLRDSYKDLTVEMNGKEYRIMVTADSQTGKMDGYLWENGEPLTSGKVSELDEQLLKVFGTQDLFFSSSFASQSAESMLNLKPSKRKDFFVEFLGLGQLQVYSDRANTVSKHFAGKIEGIRDSIVRLERDSQGIDQFELERTGHEERIASLTPDLERAQEELKQTEGSIGAIELKLSEQETIRRAVKSLQARRDEARAEYDKASSKLRGEMVRIEQSIAQINKEIETGNRQLADIEALQKPEEPEELPEAPKPSPRAAEIRQDLEAVDRELTDLRKVETAVAMELQQLESAYAVHMAGLRTNKTAHGKLAALSAGIPAIADRGICSDCSFARAALTAVEEEKAVDQKLLESTARYEEKKPIIIAKRDAIDAKPLNEKRIALNLEMNVVLEADRTSLREFQTTQERIQKQRRARTAWLEQANKGEALRTSIQHRQELLTENTVKAKAIAEEINVGFYTFTDRAKIMDAEIEQESQHLQDFLVDGMSPEQAIAGVREGIKTQRQEINEIAGKIETSRVSIGVLTSKIERCRTAAADLDVQRQKSMDLDRERAEWDLLRQICGRDKLQALELDAAAPAITTIANNLLSECFGGRFSVRFITMDDDGKEVFDLIVTDMNSGASTALQMKSGGQKVIVLHALRLAITMYAKEKSGRDFRTMFLDECDGALSSEVRREFVEMNRHAMKLGGFDTLFMVSHSPEVIDSVDRTIEFTETDILVA